VRTLSAELWPAAAATGIGSWPGVNSREAATTIAGELTELAHLQELPHRGPGADLVGRTAGMLAAVDSGLGVSTVAGRWRMDAGMTRDVRAAVSFLNEDLDYAEEQWREYSGTFKVQMCGPWTLVASLELASGQLVLSDPGARREVCEALGVAAAHHVHDVQRRLPQAQVVLQWDEPLISRVHHAHIRTPSGYATYRGIDTPELTAGLTLSSHQLTVPWGLHSCAPALPVAAVQAAGSRFLSFDIVNARPQDEAISLAHDAGSSLVIGCVPVAVAPGVTSESVSRPIRRYLADLGIASTEYLDRVAVSPVCGLAGSNDPRAALRAVKMVSSVLRDLDQESTRQEEMQ